MSPGYSEAQARLSFIDKFWTALGWDVTHSVQKNPYEQEVRVEKTVTVGGTQKKADYAFYIAPAFTAPLFYVEAKKPSATLDTPDNCFQLLRYAWNSNCPLSVLHDFEELLVLDCRWRPDVTTAQSKIWKRFHYTDFLDPEKFRFLYHLFSREAAVEGALAKRAVELPKPRGKSQQRNLFKLSHARIDEAFLTELEQWRADLAKSFKRDNPDLDSETLTEVTQRTLDRLVFLRFLEDKGIEQRTTVGGLGGASGTPWVDFQAASRRLDRIYNGAIFRRHPVLDADSFQVASDTFADICEELDSRNSVYNFDVIPIHILGSIYERFLGSVIIATAKQAHVEQKPEVRKAGGVYYTPEYIVRYIVEQTVGKQISGKTPEQIESMSFADIACGSGSFLLGVFECLLRYHTAWYNENPAKAERRKSVVLTKKGMPHKQRREKAGDCVEDAETGILRLTLEKKRQILTNNLFGTDLDPQAVEVAQFSLYLKLLEDETAGSTHQYQIDFEKDALLPSLDQNIICGNALIGSDIAGLFSLLPEDEEKLRPLDYHSAFPHVFKRGGFDSIVGNPPYDVVEKNRGEASWPHDLLHQYVREAPHLAPALGGKLNLYRFFIVRALELVRAGGAFGYIVPLSILADISCAATRRHLLAVSSEISSDCFPQKDNPARRVFIDAKLSTCILLAARKPPTVNDRVTVRVYPWNSFEDTFKKSAFRRNQLALIDPLYSSIPLVTQNEFDTCIKLHSAKDNVRFIDVAGVNITRGEINQTIYREYISDNSSFVRLLKGVEVAAYQIKEKLSQGHREWFDEARFLSSGNSRRQQAFEPRIATQRITGVDERLRVVATEVTPVCYFADSTNSIALSKICKYNSRYLLGILNSRLIQWRFKLTSTNNNVGTNELENLPFPALDLKKSYGCTLHDKMVDLVTQMLEAKKQEAVAGNDVKRDFWIRKAQGLDRQIDTLVYELYGLTLEEIDLVEGNAPARKEPADD
jgi:hypothetical protein